MPDRLGFDNTLLNKWLEFVATSKFITVFLLTVRFSKEFSEPELSKVVDNIKDELGGIEDFNLLCNS